MNYNILLGKNIETRGFNFTFQIKPSVIIFLLFWKWHMIIDLSNQKLAPKNISLRDMCPQEYSVLYNLHQGNPKRLALTEQDIEKLKKSDEYWGRIISESNERKKLLQDIKNTRKS